MANSYLYKDIFRLEQIKKPDSVVKLLQAIAFQIGSQVSYAELAQLCGLDGKTVCLDHYGASAPASILFKEFGFTVENVVESAKESIQNAKR